jgi:hypothetical protein
VFRGPHWTQLLVGDGAARLLDIEALPDDVHPFLIAGTRSPSFTGRVLGDRGRSFTRTYRARPGTALLIRPDGYIYWRTHAPRADAMAKRIAGSTSASHSENPRPDGAHRA